MIGDDGERGAGVENASRDRGSASRTVAENLAIALRGLEEMKSGGLSRRSSHARILITGELRDRGNGSECKIEMSQGAAESESTRWIVAMRGLGEDDRLLEG